MSLSASTVAARGAWLPAVEVSTAQWRSWRAADYLRRGERALVVDCETESEAVWREFRDCAAVCPVNLPPLQVGVESRVLPVNGWHYRRAMAHLDRFERLADCDTLARSVSCDCGDRPAQTAVLHCDHWRLCFECQGRRASRYRARFELGRQRALERSHARLCDVRRRWSEKFWTFTVPHSGSVASDIGAMSAAWSLLRGSLSRYLRREGYADQWSTVPYWRSTEVTESDGGHAHYHVWLVAPFLPVALVRHWWGRALAVDYQARLPRVWLCDVLATADSRNHGELRKAAILDPRYAALVRDACARWQAAKRSHGARSLEGTSARARYRLTRDEASFLFAPVVDVRACTEGTAAELVKYIVKMGTRDADGALQLMHPDVYAPIYAALDCARIVATSVAWLGVAPLPDKSCECCGAMLEVRIVHAPTTHDATAPPTAGA